VHTTLELGSLVPWRRHIRPFSHVSLGKVEGSRLI